MEGEPAEAQRREAEDQASLVRKGSWLGRTEPGPDLLAAAEKNCCCRQGASGCCPWPYLEVLLRAWEGRDGGTKKHPAECSNLEETVSWAQY